jgi:GxxExxY protein
MPIIVNADLIPMTQRQFSVVAYEVMAEAFSIHNELGSLFDEAVYRNALAARLTDVLTEVQIKVAFGDFQKDYFVDALVSSGGVFEFKAVGNIVSRHRSQLLNYLLLMELSHGKLINFGARQVEHEFVNTNLTYADRVVFSVDDNCWTQSEGFGADEKNLVLDILHDWGVGLEGVLYKNALMHFIPNKYGLPQKLDVFQNGRSIAQQPVSLCGEFSAIHVTTIQDENPCFEKQLIRLINSTKLESLQWINVARQKVTFKTLQRSENKAD